MPQDKLDFYLDLYDSHLKNTLSTNENTYAWTSKQTYIALGNLMTVCAVEKIDNCPMEGFVPAKVDEILHLKEKNLKSVLMLPVGFRTKDDIMYGAKKVRKPLEDIIIEM